MNTISEFVPTASELLYLQIERQRAESQMRQYARFYNEYELARFNHDSGYHWFDADSKRFFSSRVGAILHGDSPANFNIFVSSERDTWSNQPRRYTVRQLLIDGSITDIGTFQQYATSASAKRAALNYIKSQER